MLWIAMIVDDPVQRPYFEKLLDEHLAGIPHKLHIYETISEFEKSEENIDLLDLIVLSAQQKERNPVVWIAELQKKHPYGDVIFLTDSLECAPQLYEANHVGLIYTKGIGLTLEKALRRVLQRKNEKEQNALKVRWRNTFFLIPMKDILYIEKVLRKNNIYAKDRVYTTYQKLDELYEELDENFMRCHFSYVVNKNCIKEFSSSSLTMQDGKFIPVSRTYSKAVLEYVHALFGMEKGNRTTGRDEQFCE